MIALLPARPAAAAMFGTDSQPCGDKLNTVAIVDCVQAKTKTWDRRLKAAFQDLKRRIDAGQREPLTAAQRLWVRFRDANCRFYGSQEGSIRQIQAAECVRAMTRQRALELERAMKFD